MHATLMYKNTIELLRMAKYLSVADLEAAAKAEKIKRHASTLGIRHLFAAAGLPWPTNERIRKARGSDADRLPGMPERTLGAPATGTDATDALAGSDLPDRRLDDAANL